MAKQRRTREELLLAISEMLSSLDDNDIVEVYTVCYPDIWIARHEDGGFEVEEETEENT